VAAGHPLRYARKIFRWFVFKSNGKLLIRGLAKRSSQRETNFGSRSYRLPRNTPKPPVPELDGDTPATCSVPHAPVESRALMNLQFSRRFLWPPTSAGLTMVDWFKTFIPVGEWGTRREAAA